MVFISFPASFTSEEESLLKKYEKLERKRKSKEVTKVEPKVVSDNVKPLKVQDAKEVIAKLKRNGQLPVIEANKKTGFKRKQPVSTPLKPNASAEDEAREVVSYDDNDLFS